MKRRVGDKIARIFDRARLVIFYSIAVFAFAGVVFLLPVSTTRVAAQTQSEHDTELDELFANLKLAKSEDDAELLANKIYIRFRQSGSDTLDLMAARAREAMGKGDLPIAAEILSRVIMMDPNWAEAWNLRATVFFMMGDHERAKADVVEVLSREPRQFGALTGVALIFEMEARPKDALKTYRQVLEIAPELKSIKAAVARLEKAYEQQL